MRKMWAIWIVLLLFVVGCSGTNATPAENAPANDPAPAQNEATTAPQVETDTSPTEDAAENVAETATESATEAVEPTAIPETCYPDGEHPIAVSIATQYSETTDYVEVMAWFCEGALFEDILNALLTEDLTGVDAYELLQRNATGTTWDDLWVELGVVEK